MNKNFSFNTLETLRKNTIVDISNKSFNYISNYVINHRKEHGDTNIQFPFTEGVIEKKEIQGGLFLAKPQTEVCYWYFKVLKFSNDSFTLLMEMYFQSQDGLFTGLNTGILDIGKNGFNIKPLEECEKLNSIYEKKLKTDFSLLLDTLLYISIINQEKKTIYKEAEKKISSSSSNRTPINTAKRKSIKVLNEDKIMYLVDGDNKHIEHLKKRRCITVSFDVMGHYRHYKNGSVVWINQYRKGTGKKESSIYTIK